MNFRFSPMITDDLYIKLMVLDPRFRCLLMSESERETIIDKITSEIESRRKREVTSIPGKKTFLKAQI